LRVVALLQKCKSVINIISVADKADSVEQIEVVRGRRDRLRSALSTKDREEGPGSVDTFRHTGECIRGWVMSKHEFQRTFTGNVELQRRN